MPYLVKEAMGGRPLACPTSLFQTAFRKGRKGIRALGFRAEGLGSGIRSGGDTVRAQGSGFWWLERLCRQSFPRGSEKLGYHLLYI